MEANVPRVNDEQAHALYDYLSVEAHGRANAIPARVLARALRLGANGDRLLRALVHRAADLGLLICADNSGYFIPSAPAEVDETIGRLLSQAAEMNQRARRLEQLSTDHFYSTQLPLI